MRGQSRAFVSEMTTTDGFLPNPSALETDFPATLVSKVATAESWRKEVHRPASHTHKWWAQRLGSVVRAVVIASYSVDAKETVRRINNGVSLEGVRILDPFAGSGTTLVEAKKLGASCTGVDINPVASLVQRQALQPWDQRKLEMYLQEVEAECREEIDELHSDVSGAPVLYYFWVAQAKCSSCYVPTDLFSSYVFSRHAYPRRYPQARAVCSVCGLIESINLSHQGLGICANGHDLNVRAPVRGQTMICTNGHRTRLVDALGGKRPTYRMYAKMVLDGDSKIYRAIDSFDVELYSEACSRLQRSTDIVRPAGTLEDGFNTRQAIRWGFVEWAQFFNNRQLYCLGLLGRAICNLRASAEREALCALFSGTLEFNNMFCSFKGEGTGAVRHMFSHHILKPERTPLEAHPWGTPKSSGSFSTLFRSRILRAHNYKEDPHDIVFERANTERRRGISRPLTEDAGSSWEVITGDAAKLPHEDDTFDLVITDPPYFDKVHYSELADFFHAWLKNLDPYPGYACDSVSTRHKAEVQDTDVDRFRDALGRVFKESVRVMKPEGLLAFSFHHGTPRAWKAVVAALRTAGLTITSVQPVKAEMSTSSTKSGAKEPNNLDSMVICRPIGTAARKGPVSGDEAARVALVRLNALRDGGVDVGLGDVRSAIMACVIATSTAQGQTADLETLTTRALQLAEAACQEWT